VPQVVVDDEATGPRGERIGLSSALLNLVGDGYSDPLGSVLSMREDVVDLRSDTVTKPTEAMRKAMYDAEVGDDVVGEDPTVNRLQELVAERLGTEAAVFAATGTQSNLIGILAHCGRGDEYLVGQEAHTYRWEGGGAAVLGSVQPQPIHQEPDGTLDLVRVAREVKPIDDHFARTRLLCLEDTTAGKVLPLDYLGDARKVADEHGIATHLDGARLFNASVALGVEPVEITRHFHTTSICLSKGLGAPVGSVLAGPTGLVEEAHRWRKVLGGGMRQAGVVAAAGIHALEHHVDRLAEDHANARALAEGLASVPGIGCDPDLVQSNMVLPKVVDGDPEALASVLAARGVVVRPGRTMRLVLHLDVQAEDVPRVVDGFAAWAKGEAGDGPVRGAGPSY
jgi:threonine aldolase